jgi:uncharacterized protein (DUF111 family)
MKEKLIMIHHLNELLKYEIHIADYESKISLLLVKMRYFEFKSMREISNEYKIPITEVQRRIMKGIQHLERHI